MNFHCVRHGKDFPTLRALIIHAEVKREDGVLAVFRDEKEEKKEKSDVQDQ